MNSRTRAPRFGSDSISRCASNWRSASRTGPWLTPSSVAIRRSTTRSPGSQRPELMPSTMNSRIWSASPVRSSWAGVFTKLDRSATMGKYLVMG